jgi:DNA-binding beta-propeller fold protein YncE
VFVAPPGQATAAVPTTFISTTLLRATLPANVLTAAGQDQISVVRQNGSSNAPGPLALTVNPVRPAIVASSPDSVSQTSGSTSLQLTGGFFAAAASTVSFNGGPVVPSLSSSRQLSVPIPAGGLAVPGLYPVVVQNAGISVGLPSLSAVNLAVAPVQANIPTSPTANIAVGSSPSAVAIDYASGVAVVANTGSNNVSLVNLNTNPPSPLGGAIAVGTSPTGVAIDDLLPHHVAVVVNSADQTVSTIDLTGRRRELLLFLFRSASIR